MQCQVIIKKAKEFSGKKNKLNNNCECEFYLFILRDVLAISAIDAFTSIVCGSTVFSVLGYIAKTQSKAVEDVVESGPGLIFM